MIAQRIVSAVVIPALIFAPRKGEGADRVKWGTGRWGGQWAEEECRKNGSEIEKTAPNSKILESGENSSKI